MNPRRAYPENMKGKNDVDDHELVLIAGYRDLESAHEDFNEVERRMKHGLEMRSAALVGRTADGAPEVLEATNRHGRVAVGVGAGLGAIFGLFAPPLALSVLVGAAAGGLLAAFTEHELRVKLEHEVGRGAAPDSPPSEHGRVCPRREQVDGGHEEIVARPRRQTALLQAPRECRLHARQQHDPRPLLRRREPVGQRNAATARRTGHE